MTDQEARIKELEKENRELKEKINREHQDNSAWDFHWDGRGSYEESRRCFYGNFG